MNWQIKVYKTQIGWSVGYLGDNQHNPYDVQTAHFKTKQEADLFAKNVFKEIAIRFKLIKQSKEWVI